MPIIAYETESGVLGRTLVNKPAEGETVADNITAMMDAGRLPNLPWAHYCVVPDGGAALASPPAWWSVDWEAGTITVKEPAPGADDLKDALATLRYKRESSGIDVRDMQVATDNESLAKIVGARMKADKDASFTTRWKAINGWFPLNAEEIVAMSDAALAFISACFDAEEAVSVQIDAGAISTLDELTTAFETALTTELAADEGTSEAA
ncbi:uncharacterized protein DUF4376 [Breoghania corrubedonensis]|uniref:Uncharacterized protein DUF4376 n=1 Tax=Breoghania corrubedonensis TaxID=665038 RepID=A0A2T5UPY9_9HYPH|nr:DUF4376 domain-containing protein [Breoghania corrubedonensis]PTW53569.1 uncharacterized protein DUF4376 [Breoghania corrubedonensis]